MEQVENEAGGTSVLLDEGDDLRKVPRSHRHLLTDALRAAFPDPVGYFAGIARRCPFPKMRRWLKALVAEGSWQLQLHQGWPEEWNLAGFKWRSQKVGSAVVGLPSGAELAALCPALHRYYELVGEVHWDSFEMGGGLGDGSGYETPMTAFQFIWTGDKLDLETTYCWGTGTNGEMLVYTRDGRAGWVDMGNVHMLGTVEEGIDWIYGRLLAKRLPQFDHRRWK